MISRRGYSWASVPTIQFAEYQSWKNNTEHLFTDVAFYQPILMRVHMARNKTAELSIARGSDNLFELLQTPIESTTPNRANHDHAVGLILSHEAWRKHFGADPNIAGQIIDVGGQEVVVVGVAASDSWRLPGEMDGWLLEDQQQLAKLPSRCKGFMLAQVRASSFSIPSDGQFEMTVTKKNGDLDRYDCLSLAEQSQEPFFLFLFALALACLSVPATTALPLGEYPANNDRLPWTTRIRRWIFLLTKIALIVPIIYFVSIDLAYFSGSISPVYSQYIQLGTSFPAFLFAFRWALRDQRKRCPVCLRLLTHPARVGQSSRNFLAWNGTELICVEGHGLLHVPDIPTSWFSSQRWLYLDASWIELFSGAYLGTL